MTELTAPTSSDDLKSPTGTNAIMNSKKGAVEVSLSTAPSALSNTNTAVLENQSTRTTRSKQCTRK